MHRVVQRQFEKGDCGVACVAMVTGKSYEEINQLFHDAGLVRNDEYFTQHKDLIGILERLGFGVRRRMFKSWKNVHTPAIVKINVRTGNFWHWVVLTQQGTLHDPKPNAPEIVTDLRGKKGSGQYLEIIARPN